MVHNAGAGQKAYILHMHYKETQKTSLSVCLSVCLSVVSVTVKRSVLLPCVVDGRSRNPLYYYYYYYYYHHHHHHYY